MDVAFAGVVCATIAIVVGLLGDGRVDMTLVGAGVLIYGAYLIGAIRLGVSPITYLRNVGRRGRAN